MKQYKTRRERRYIVHYFLPNPYANIAHKKYPARRVLFASQSYLQGHPKVLTTFIFIKVLINLRAQ